MCYRFLCFLFMLIAFSLFKVSWPPMLHHLVVWVFQIFIDFAIFSCVYYRMLLFILLMPLDLFVGWRGFASVGWGRWEAIPQGCLGWWGWVVGQVVIDFPLQGCCWFDCGGQAGGVAILPNAPSVLVMWRFFSVCSSWFISRRLSVVASCFRCSSLFFGRACVILSIDFVR